MIKKQKKINVINYVQCDDCGYEYAKVIRKNLIDCVCGIKRIKKW
jgi:hypothetical protein